MSPDSVREVLWEASDVPLSQEPLARVQRRIRRTRRLRACTCAVAVVGLVAAVAVLRAAHGRDARLTVGLTDPPRSAPATAAARQRADGAPDKVWLAAQDLAERVAEHPPADAVWVASTLGAWRSLAGQPGGADDGTEVYVVMLRSATPLTCTSCRGIGSTRSGRFVLLVQPVEGDAAEFVVTDVEYRLSDLGTVRPAGSGL